MSKIQELLSKHENRRFDFFKDNEGNTHMVDRHVTKEGHYRMLLKKDGSKDVGYISHEEYEKIKSTFENTGNFNAYEEFFKNEKKVDKKDEQDPEGQPDKDDDEDDEEEDDDDKDEE